MRKFKLPSKVMPGRTDHFVIGEMSDLVASARSGQNNIGCDLATSWHGGMTRPEACRSLESGHAPSAKASDEFLKAVEDLLPVPTSRHTIVADVVGAFPNVPAFLAGQPMNMRRKAPRESEAAPIAIICDTTSSAGIPAENMAKRGAAMVALARALAGRRPVELYASTGLDADMTRNAIWQFWRIETQPMDLSRAAFLLGHPSATRVLQYHVANRDYGYRGTWPYGGNAIREDKYKSIVMAALPHLTDCIVVPAVMVNDAAINEPVEWIKHMVALYGADDGIAEAE